MPTTKKEKAIEYPKQDQAELDAMAEFYRKQYGSVYFVRCLHCQRVIAVEVPTANGNIPTRGRQIYGYQELFVTTRERLDKNADGGNMVGYQCTCGNDTRLGEVERGEVPTSIAAADKSGKIVVPAPPLKSLSPFEREQLRNTIAKRQVSSGKADYEINGNIERFETFQLERVA